MDYYVNNSFKNCFCVENYNFKTVIEINICLSMNLMKCFLDTWLAPFVKGYKLSRYIIYE